MRKRHFLIVAAGCLLIAIGPLTAVARAADKPAASLPAPVAIDPANPPPGVFADEWYAVMLAGKKCGQMHTRMARLSGKGGDIIETWTKMQLTLRRDQAEVSIGIEQKTNETLDGVPRSFLRTMYLGRQPVTTEGTVTNGKVSIASTQFGQQLPAQVYDYPAGALMDWGAYREQFRRGLKPGTKYDVLVYEPTVSPDRPCKTTFEVLGPEVVDLFGRKVEAIKTRQAMQLPQATGKPTTQDTTLWLTDAGTVVRMTMTVLEIPIEVFGCSKAVAMADNDPAELMVGTLVQLAGPIDADRATRITYRIRLKNPSDSNPLPDFPDTAMQKVTAHSDREATVVVSRASALTGVRPQTLSPEDRQRCLAASAAVNYKDPKVADLARQAAGSEKDPRKLADKLSRFVSGYISTKSLNVGFATASEVARSREGDCTEHGVLLAALGRACGIPSRIVTGLVYTDSFAGRSNVLVGHLWTQFWIDGQWVDVDTALRQDTNVDPTHIAMAIGSAGDDGFADMIAATWLSLGRLNIQVIRTEPK